MDAHLQMGRSNIMFEDVKAAADENGAVVYHFEIVLQGVGETVFFNL